MTELEQAVLNAAVAWRAAVEAYERECRREHQPHSAYPEARRRRDDDD